MFFRSTDRATTFQGAEVEQSRIAFASQRDQIRFLRKMVEHFRTHPDIRARARDIVFRCGLQLPRDQRGHALTIGQWVQDRITYVGELPETFQSPITTIAEGYGDCDDMAVLVGALCESVGIPTELVGMEWVTTNPRTLTELVASVGIPQTWLGLEDVRHIYARAVLPNGAAVPLDATLPYPVVDEVSPINLAERIGAPINLLIA